MLNEKTKATLIILVSALFGIYCFVFGQSGLLERIYLNNQKEIISKEIAELEADNAQLYEYLLANKSGKHYEKEAYLQGYIREGQKRVVFNSDDPPGGEKSQLTRITLEKSHSETQQLRILWIILSFFIIFLYIVRKQSLATRKDNYQ
ncbi:MAG: hypothetical protein PF637_08315 [Spirochaetes bacterium]|nr:hypothetical protein [Spirochaetota bacterium]